MDNASKALIMAGAILISIAIVGVGVYIFSSTGSINNQAGQQIDAAAAQTTNGILRSYAGTKVRGAVVIELMGNISVWNAQSVFPKDIGYSASGDIKKGEENNVVTNHFYTVSFSDENGDGYYDEVEITDKNKATT